MPKLWSDTIDAHRAEVRQAIFKATIALASEHGLRSVTMSQIAQQAGIGRATLYKYFSDVDAILIEWHEQVVDAHIARLRELGDATADPAERVRVVLAAYAQMVRHRAEHDTSDVAILVHATPQVEHARQRLHELMSDLIAVAADSGVVRDDTPAGELARFVLAALEASAACSSQRAVDRLVAITAAALRPDHHT